jgi:SpoU rRNA methylase family enzyme
LVEDVVVVLHDVSSVQRLVDMARLVYGLGFRTFVASKVYGAAATNGIPEVTKLALRLGVGFYVVSTVKDVVELMRPDTVIVVSYEHGEPVEPSEVAKLARGRTVVVFGGSDASPTREEASLGKPIYVKGVRSRLGPIAEAALILYPLLAVRSR